MDKLDIEIIAPLSSLSNRTRLYKLAKYLLNLDQSKMLKHVGWERISGESKESCFQDKNIAKKILLSGGGYGGFKVKVLYFVWIVKVFFYCLTLSSNKTVWALGFESAFPALMASKIRKFKVVFDDADRFSLIFPLPVIIKNIVQRLEVYASKNVFLHIIPGKERYDFHSDKFHVLKNMPSQSELDLAKEIYQQRDWPDSDLIINVNGWLGEDRGMLAALTLSKAFINKSFTIILAGKVDCPHAKELSEQKNVLYLGNISNAEALASYLCSDFVLTYYDPKNIINQLAESNKWGDAIKSGTKIIVNKEVKTAAFLNQYNLSVSVPYDDHDALIDALNQYNKNKSNLSKVDNNTSNNFENFEIQLERIMTKIGY